MGTAVNNLKRLSSWPVLLDHYLTSKREARFEWGSCDCALFACDAVLAMTGTDMAKGFRGRYKTEQGAARAMLRFAGGGLREVAEKIAGKWGLQQLKSVYLACRGDVALLPHEHGEAIGIVGMDSRWVMSMGLESVTAVPITTARAAWRI